MIDCDDQPIDNAYEQGLRDAALAAYVDWSYRHHTAWAQNKYGEYRRTLGSAVFLPMGVRVVVNVGEPSAASLAEIPERDFSKARRNRYAKRLKAGEAQ